MKVEDEKQELASTDRPMKFSDMVKFKMAYPKEYTKKKHYKDGETIELHRLQAEDWEARKLGSILK